MEQTQTLRPQDPADISILHGMKSSAKSGEEQVKVANESRQEIPWRTLLDDSNRTGSSLQATLRANLAEAVLEGRIPEGTRLPSTRALASLLKVARITVSMAYDALEAQGLIVVRERSGHYVAKRLWAEQELAKHESSQPIERPMWTSHFPALPHGEKRLEKPRQWHKYRFPFVSGKVDQELFPLADWRECSRLAQATPDSGHWSYDAFDGDDRFLLEQLCSNVLPKRGITASPDEVLITMGSQMGAFILSELLTQRGTTVALEDPGYTEARNLFLRRGANILSMGVDDSGAIPPAAIAAFSVLYLTPSHQCPTGATLTAERRLAFLNLARRHESLIIEDDYDAQAQFATSPVPALKATDTSGHVIHLGSFSKVFAPGLRIGYMVADRALIDRARHLRRLMIRHTPGNNQRALALFLSRGHYERLAVRYRALLQGRAQTLSEAIRRYLPTWQFREPQGGSALWVQGASESNMADVALRAREKGILIESGGSFFHAAQPPQQFARLAYSAIDQKLIEPGVRLLAQVTWEQRNNRRQ
jgi:GntR family transcriptional regulator / MocR family aminotransferase